MRCTHCGIIMPPGVLRCPICGTCPDSAQAQEDYRSYQQYPKTNYQQGVPPDGREYGYAAENPVNQPRQYATPAFHTYRKQVFTGFSQSQQTAHQSQPRDGFHANGAFFRAVSDLPQVVKGAFMNPAGTLQGMVRRADRYTGAMMVFLSAMFAFLAGMILVKGALGSVFSIASGIAGQQLADSAASLNQGVNYLAGKVAVPIGGIAALCQVIAAVMPAAVAMVYISAVRQVRFSLELLSGFTAITVLPNLAALVLASVCSLITPYLSLLMLFFGQVFSYVLLCTMTVQIVELESPKTVLVQSALICLSELTKIALFIAVGGSLLSGVIRTLTSLTNSMGGLL